MTTTQHDTAPGKANRIQIHDLCAHIVREAQLIMQGAGNEAAHAANLLDSADTLVRWTAVGE